MNGRSPQTGNAVLYVLAGIFAVLAMALGRLIRLPFFVIAALAIVLGLLGLALVVLTAGLTGARTRKAFFTLTGASAAGIPICAVSHNVVYGLFIVLFGKGFWGSGGDEPFFFILAVFVCPALFLVGTAGSVALLVKTRMARNRELP